MMDYRLLSALDAVLVAGTFEKAAAKLGLTQSAVSQRVKQLEDQVGSLLIVRATPCTPTPAGARLQRHAHEVALLERTAWDDLGQQASGPRPTIRIAVNADSLATWFADGLAGVPNCNFDLVLEDEAHTLDWLRRGEVAAAVSTMPGPLQGCDTSPLGRMAYVASASPDFVATWFAQGLTPESLHAAPAIAFNAKDNMHLRWIERMTGRAVVPPVHHVASPEAIVHACTRGLGWALNPRPLAEPLLAAGALVPLAKDDHDVDLYWHCSRVVAPAMAALSASVHGAARQVLGSCRQPIAF